MFFSCMLVAGSDQLKEQSTTATKKQTTATTIVTTTKKIKKTKKVVTSTTKPKETTTTKQATTAEQTTTTQAYKDSSPTFDGIKLQYSAAYNITSNHLTRSGGVAYYNGHTETYYSQRVLPGPGLKIPGRHVADDGTIRDEDGYICAAAAPSYYAYGSYLMTSLGPAKIYDTGCDYGIIDIYVDW